MSLIHNERTKLLANALDRASTACVTVGVFGPAVAVLYDLGGASGTAGPFLAIGTLLWLIAASVLHFLAWLTLGSLK